MNAGRDLLFQRKRWILGACLAVDGCVMEPSWPIGQHGTHLWEGKSHRTQNILVYHPHPCHTSSSTSIYLQRKQTPRMLVAHREFHLL